MNLGSGIEKPGRIPRPDPAEVPAGMTPCEDAAQLYYAWESSSGGERLSAAEAISVTVFNAGYALRDLELRVRGLGRDNSIVFDKCEEVAEIGHGMRAEFEVASYLIAEPMRVLKVALVSAGFTEATE